MADLTLITDSIPEPNPTGTLVPISVSRGDLAKRRWRAVAEDGREFGFDLTHPLHNGDYVFAEGSTSYQLQQRPEPVLQVKLGTPDESARLGWTLGNLHFPVEVGSDYVRTIDDPATRQALDRAHIHYHAVEAVFLPLAAVPHGHTH
jgi:urease accessory protein